LNTLKLQIMKKKIFLLAVTSSILFISCKKDEEVKPAEESQQPAQPFSGEAWLKQRVDGQGQQKPVQQQPQQAVQTQQQVQTAPGMNPPHGQPGHRCDISVGAPLNSPAKSGAISTQSQAITTKAAPAAPAAQPAPAGLKINPAHGQPGHRCELAVGAPLTGSTSSKLTTDSIK
jgi:hypothetical protein